MGFLFLRSVIFTFPIKLLVIAMKTHIPTYRISDQLPGDIAWIRKVVETDVMQGVDHAHRDDYFIFLFCEKGKGLLLLDFETYELTNSTIFCILPGQVHFPLTEVKACGWFLAVDSMIVKDEYKEIFRHISFLKKKPVLDVEMVSDFNYFASMLHRKLQKGRSQTGQLLIHDLLSAYIGLFAAVYREELPLSATKRPAILTFRFKTLLSSHFRTLKRPSAYASLLNISPVYLNEVVKCTTGKSAGDCIREEIIVQAKRLLFYTDLPVKEIALDLGYEDWAYFTRLFKSHTGISPTDFRRNYLK